MSDTTSTREIDYKGFGEHLSEWEDKGIPYGTRDLIRLARLYNTPIPGTAEYEKEFSSNQLPQ